MSDQVNEADAGTGTQDLGPSEEFLANFRTPMGSTNGSGEIMNAFAQLLPTVSDTYRDNSTLLDYRLPGGLGVAKPYRKPDSMGGSTPEGFYGPPRPNKNFGRDSRAADLAWDRESLMERARMNGNFRGMGSKPHEVPKFAAFFPWQWNEQKGVSGNQYNRHYGTPDAEEASRRLYQPTPSRAAKMKQGSRVATDTETLSIRPTQTALHPLKVVSEDPVRQAYTRIGRNTDVAEHVRNEMPRGMKSLVPAPYVFSNPDENKKPVGTNDTGDRSVLGVWPRPFSDPLAHQTMEDSLQRMKHDAKYVRGHNLDAELHYSNNDEKSLAVQRVPDPWRLT